MTRCRRHALTSCEECHGTMSVPLTFTDVAFLWYLCHESRATGDGVLSVYVDGTDLNVTCSEFLEDLAERLAANLPADELGAPRAPRP